MEAETGWMWDADDLNESMRIKDLLFTRDADRDHKQYSDAVYLTLVTMSSVGYGDYSPKTVGERQWCMITILTSMFLNAYIIGAFRSALHSLHCERRLSERSSLRFLMV